MVHLWQPFAARTATIPLALWHYLIGILIKKQKEKAPRLRVGLCATLTRARLQNLILINPPRWLRRNKNYPTPFCERTDAETAQVPRPLRVVSSADSELAHKSLLKSARVGWNVSSLLFSPTGRGAAKRIKEQSRVELELSFEYPRVCPMYKTVQLC